MAPPRLNSPGVYIQEQNAFGNAVVQVATAVPAFIGYTPQAQYQGESYLNKATKISSMAEFRAIFLYPDSPAPAPAAKQYSPQYYLIEQASKPVQGKYLSVDNRYYSIAPDPSTIYYFYNSIRLFFQNGGGDCYIVSVGAYGAASGKPMADSAAQIINPNVLLADLQAGLSVLKSELEPTLYICPEATLLSVKDNAILMQAMLQQAEAMQTAVCIFDIVGGGNPDPVLYSQDITTFRSNVGTQGLRYGASYYPFVCTNVMQNSELDFTNFFGGNVANLAPLLNPTTNPNGKAKQILDAIQNPPAKPLTRTQYQSALLVASSAYASIFKRMVDEANVLPASGGIAGVYTTNDNIHGVWHAPANVGLVGVTDLPLHLSTQQQENLNVDAVAGKSVNALRNFSGRGILIWGARTLDGNSNEWRYVPVRRTLNMIEQSVKLAAQAYVFEPNDANTWAGIKNMVSSFLTSIWQAGGLQGSTPKDAFVVNVGVGSTMTVADVSMGMLRVMIGVAVIRPAEFIVITFAQKMPVASIQP